MARGPKLLEAMRRNPQGDWTIRDIVTLCAAFGVSCTAPANGSHYKAAHPKLAEKLTIPARRPIKPIYIVKLVRLIEQVQEMER